VASDEINQKGVADDPCERSSSMKSRFTEKQIAAILKEAEIGTKVILLLGFFILSSAF